MRRRPRSSSIGPGSRSCRCGGSASPLRAATRASQPRADKPEILDDPRLEPAIQWLRKLDWFTPEPGLWVGDANETFLGQLAAVWAERPAKVECLGNPAF